MSEEEYHKIISRFIKDEWLPLLNLIPYIENTKEFCTLRICIEQREGVYQEDYVEPAEVVLEFCRRVQRMNLILNFDWAHWNEGRKIVRTRNFDYDTIDIPTKCKIITAIVRNDRYCTGALVFAFESGLILKILKSIERQVSSIHSN